MAAREGIMTMDEARAYMDGAKALFNRKSSDGVPLELVFQGGEENYYLTDKREGGNFQFFVAQAKKARELTGNNSVLVAPCSFGFEMELLAQEGFDVAGFDISEGMVTYTRDRLARMGIEADLRVDDVTQLNPANYQPEYAGVMCVHVVPGIPVVENDALLRDALGTLTSLTPRGAFYLSTTWYEDPQYQREWKSPEGEVLGATTYFRRSPRELSGMIRENGLAILRCEHYDSAKDPENEWHDYGNDYFIAAR